MTSLDLELEGVPLDRLVVKLNIEGAEPLALKGMTATLGRASSVRLFVELNPPALRAAGADPRRLIEQLTDQGLSVSWIDPVDESLSPVTSDGDLRKGHLYCARD